MLIHATAVARHGVSGWSAVLLTGPTGSGKSDIALRLMDRGWRLIADDQSFVWRSGPALYVGLHPQFGSHISGRIEVRGLGVATTTHTPPPLARLRLVCACGHRDVDRLPDEHAATYFGLALPRLDVDVRLASAPLVIETAFLEALRTRRACDDRTL